MSPSKAIVREIRTRLTTGIRNLALLLAAALGLGIVATENGTIAHSFSAIQSEPLSRFALVQSWTGTFSLSGSGNGAFLHATWQASQSANGAVVLDQFAIPHAATVGEWTGSNSGSASVSNSWTHGGNCFARVQGAGSISSDLYVTPPRLSVSTNGTYLFTPGNLTVEAVISGNCGMQTQTHRIMWGPAPTRGEGPVPVSGLVLAGSRQIRAAVPVFGLTAVEGAEIDWTFSWNLQPGSSAELVVEPTNYDTWRPEGGANEQSAGNDIQIRASLQTPSGSPSTTGVRKIVFELLSVSTEPGVAMNYPAASASNDADLRFVSGGTATVVSSDGRRAETPEGVM